eukprot:scaffold226276_cov55-Attheya_sp.AAC.3
MLGYAYMCRLGTSRPEFIPVQCGVVAHAAIVRHRQSVSITVTGRARIAASYAFQVLAGKKYTNWKDQRVRYGLPVFIHRSNRSKNRNVQGRDPDE